MPSFQQQNTSTTKKIPPSSSSRGIGNKKTVRFDTMQIVQQQHQEVSSTMMTEDEIKRSFYNYRDIHNFKYDSICVVQQEIDRRNNEVVERSLCSSPSKKKKEKKHHQSPEQDDDNDNDNETSSTTLRGLEHLLANNGGDRKMNRTNAFKVVFEEQTRQRQLQQEGRDNDDFEERLAATYKTATEESIETAYLIGLSDAIEVQQQQQHQQQCRRRASTTTRRISFIMIRSSIRKHLFSLTTSHNHGTKNNIINIPHNHRRNNNNVLGRRVSPFGRDTH